MGGACDDGTGDVAAAASEGLYLALGVGAVESGDDESALALQDGSEGVVGFGVEVAACIEVDVVGGVDEGGVEYVGDEFTVEEFAA